MGDIKEYILATRPWSFTAGLVPVLVTTAVVGQSFTSENTLRACVMALTVQAGANLTNTYYDYVNGLDTKSSVCGDMTLVNKKMSPGVLYLLSIICYVISILAVYPLLVGSLLMPSNRTFTIVFAAGIILAFFYTANPVGLKYRALGDITIFLCFGPLLMQATSIIMTGQTSDDLYIYSIPLGLLTEGILHANNARDIKADSMAGCTTLATLIGFDNSYIVYCLLFAGAYVSALYVSLYFHIGCLATFLTIPLAMGCCSKFKAKELTELPEETAKMHLPFGIMMLLGIVTTSSGIL